MGFYMYMAVVLYVAIFTLALSLVIAWVLMRIFESRYRTLYAKKDETIRLFREQLKLASEHNKARMRATQVKPSASNLELEVLALLSGPPMLFNTFRRLTDQLTLTFEWDPSKEPFQWEGRENATRGEIGRIAAIRVLRDEGYTGNPLPTVGGFAFIASNYAITMRTAYNSLPEALKAKARQRQQQIYREAGPAV